MPIDTSDIESRIEALTQAKNDVINVIKSLMTDQTLPLNERWGLYCSRYSVYGYEYKSIHEFDAFNTPKWCLQRSGRSGQPYVDRINPFESLEWYGYILSNTKLGIFDVVFEGFEYPDVANCQYNRLPRKNSFREEESPYITQEEVDALKEEIMSKMISGFYLLK